MARTIRTFLPVVGDPTALSDAFTGDPQRWLPGSRRDGPDTWLLLLRAGALSRTVRATVGEPWRAGGTRWRSLSWDPVPAGGEPGAIDRLLPSLDGELGLHVQPGGAVTLVFDARYLPPGGALGDAVDAVAMSRVARGTVERFLEELTAALGSEALLIGGASDDEPAGPHPRRLITH